MTKTYPRVHVIHSSESENAIVLVKKSKQTCVYKWNLETNDISLGQCTKARIYEYRSDLSPNGMYFLYAAYENRNAYEVRGMYAALSKAPYLKAVDLYQNIEPRGGGGQFINNQSYRLNEIFFDDLKFYKKESKLYCINSKDEHCLFGDVGIYLSRLKRLGWSHKGASKDEKNNNTQLFEKNLTPQMTLKKIIHFNHSLNNKPSIWEHNEIFNKATNSNSKKDWNWADIINNTLFFTQNGIIKTAQLTQKNELTNIEPIHSFQEFKFEEVNAPY